MRIFFQIISWLIADAIFVNMAYYSGYLIRFSGIIEMPAFMPYLRLWPYITFAHLIVFSIFKLYEPAPKVSKRAIFTGIINASAVSTLAAMSIVYAMRHFWGFMPSSVFALGCVFNIILSGGWRIFVRYDT